MVDPLVCRKRRKSEEVVPLVDHFDREVVPTFNQVGLMVAFTRGIPNLEDIVQADFVGEASTRSAIAE